MKRNTFVRGMGALLGAVVFGPALTACGGGDEETADLLPAPSSPLAGSSPAAGDGSSGIASAQALDADELAGLRYMREEEKLAHDVYVAMFSTWGLKVFSSIAESETTHADAVLGQIERYGVTDPAAGKPAGDFQDQGLQALYNQLIVMGSVSLVEALRVGCLIEETDIRDIRDKMAETHETGILKVYQNLLCGSHSHLQTFYSQLVSRGGSYQPQVISQAEWDAIAAGIADCRA